MGFRQTTLYLILMTFTNLDKWQAGLRNNYLAWPNIIFYDPSILATAFILYLAIYRTYELTYSVVIINHNFSLRTSLKAYGRPRIPAPMKEMTIFAKILTWLLVVSSCISKTFNTINTICKSYTSGRYVL